VRHKDQEAKAEPPAQVAATELMRHESYKSKNTDIIERNVWCTVDTAEGSKVLHV
jgi:hypothetical protein